MSARLSFIITLIALLFLAAYAGLWMWTAEKIKGELRTLIENAENAGITVTGPFPAVGGFPGRHEIAFFGSLSHEGTILEVPGLRIKGFFLPGERVIIECADGVALRGTHDPEIWSLGHIRLVGIVPATFPSDLTVEGMRAWRDAGGHIEFTSIDLAKRNMMLAGAGRLTLDANLQPSGEFNAKLYGNYVDFLAFLQRKDMVETKQALLIGAVLASLTRTDEDGKQYLDAGVTLENNVLYLGPLRLAETPETVWPWRGLPKVDLSK